MRAADWHPGAIYIRANRVTISASPVIWRAR